MQNVVVEKPYVFVPPRHGKFWPALLRSYMPRYLRTQHGVVATEFRGTEHVRRSIAAGHGVLLAPNHCRPCDPMVLGRMSREFGRPVYIMASWHLFAQGGLQAWLLPRLGIFSVYREGLDRAAIKCATQLLVAGRRPLVIFPEGAITRTNDRLGALLDGVAFIARTAAKARAAAQPAGQVVIHPVGIRYFFEGDVEQALKPALDEFERRLTWQPRSDSRAADRIEKLGDALLALKEIEYLGAARSGSFAKRLPALIDHLLVPLEAEWLKGRRDEDVIARVKALRSAILPDMVAGEIDESERSRRWRQLADLYLAQQLSLYPPNYFNQPAPTSEQLLETMERIEEDLTDRVRRYQPLRAVVEVGEAIPVEPARPRGVNGDPLMGALRAAIERLVSGLRSRRGAA
jgi:1-acyl-sn-glycerol-3-phosphate acyltransferase